MITPALPLVQASVADSPTEGWRIIGLIAITLLTIVILAVIFRPSMRSPEAATCDGGPNGDELSAKRRPEPTGPTLLGPTLLPVQPAPTDTGLAAERLKQIVSRVTAGDTTDRRRMGDRRHDEQGTAPPGGTAEDEQRSRDEEMGTENHDVISEHDLDQAGLDAAALEEQINRLFGIRGDTGNILPFTPRKSPPIGDQEGAGAGRPRRTGEERPITQFPVDMATREGITSTIQELLFCANVGELLHGFALYTDRYLFQFMDESRMSEDEFREAYSDIPAKDPSEWTRIDAISDFERMDDGRVRVRVRYIDGSDVDGIERFIMRLDPHLDRWLIDDIQAL